MPLQDKNINIKEWFKEYDDEREDYVSIQENPSTKLRSLSSVIDSEKKRSDVANKIRMRKDKPADTSFGSQLIWGFAESAMVAPSLWESLGDMEKGDIKQKVLGDESSVQWEDMEGMDKAGYIVGAGAGMFIPFSAAGKVVKGVVGTGAKGFQAAQKGLGFTGFLTKASSKEISERISKLTGRKATELAKATDATKIAQAAEKADKGRGWAKIARHKQASTNHDIALRTELKQTLTDMGSIPAAAIDDVADIAIGATRYNTPWNTHSILENSLGKLPFIKDNIVGDLVAAASYDAILGVTYGAARAYANSYGEASFTPDGRRQKAGFNWNPNHAHLMSEALHEGAWLSLLGPVRHIAGGTGRPLMTVPRFWNKNPGAVNKIVGGIAKAWKPLGKVDPREARATLAMINQVSNGAVKNYARNTKGRYPILNKAMDESPSHWWNKISKEDSVKALGELRKVFTRSAPGIIGKEVGADLLRSLPRMGMGALAMNASAVVDVWNHTQGMDTVDRVKWTAGTSFGEGLHDTLANVVVAAMMMRSGKAFRDFNKPSGFFARGEKAQSVGVFKGKETYIKETQAGLEKLGLGRVERYQHAQQFYKMEHAPDHYKDSIINNMIQNNPEYRKMGDILRERELTDKDIKDLDIEKDIADGKFGDVESALKEYYKDADASDIQQAAENFTVYNAVKKHYEQLLGHEILHKPMTPQEALQMVTEVGNMRINGNGVNRKNVASELAELANQAGMDGVHQGYTPIIEWWFKTAEKLGIQNVVRDADSGTIIIPENLKLAMTTKEAGKSESQADMNALIDSFNHITKWGEFLGWLRPQKGVTGLESASAENWKEAVDIFNSAVLEQHKHVYGHDNTRKTLEDGIQYDRDIFTNDAWHNSFLIAKKYKQGKDVSAFLNGEYGNLSSNKDVSEITRIDEKASTLFGNKKIELDKEGVGSLGTKELADLENFITTFNRLYGMTRKMKNPSSQPTTIDVAKAQEFKKEMETLFGDAFTNEKSRRHVEDLILSDAIKKLDVPGLGIDMKKGLASLLTDNDFSPNSGEIRSAKEMNGFFDLMRAEGKSEGEIKLLQSWYANLIKAVRSTESQVIKENKRPITSASEKQNIWEALKSAEHKSRMEDVKITIDEAIDIDFKLQETILDLNKKIAEIPLDTSEKIDLELKELLSNEREAAQRLSEQVSIAIKEDNLAALKSLRGEGVNIVEYLTAIKNAHPSNAKDVYNQKLLEISEKIGEFNSVIDGSEVSKISEQKIKLHDIVDDIRSIEGQNKITDAQFMGKYQVSLEDMIMLEKTLKEGWQTDNSAVKLLTKAKADIEAYNKKFNQELETTIFDEAILHLENLSKDSKKLSGKAIADVLIEPIVTLVKSNIDIRQQRGVDGGGISKERASSLYTDVYGDIMQIMTNAYNTKQVRQLEYYRGGFNLTKKTVPNTDGHGFLALEKFIPGIEGNIFLLNQKAIDGDNRQRNITDNMFREIEAALRTPVKVNSLDARKKAAESGELGLDSVEETLVGSIDGRDFHVKRMDEGTDLVIDINRTSLAALQTAFSLSKRADGRFDSALMRRLSRLLPANHYDAETGTFSKEIQSSLKDFLALEMNKKTMGDAIFLARVIVDAPLLAEKFILGNMKSDAEIKNEWKRLKMTQPKSGFYGTKENVDFVYKVYERLAKKDMAGPDSKEAKALKALQRAFGKKGDGNLEISVIHDEMGGVGDAFSYRQTMIKRLDKKVENGEITQTERDLVVEKLEGGKSTIDAVTYLTKDAYEGLMAFLGSKDTMIQYTDNGITISAGAIKPTIAHNLVKEGGRVEEFLLKTSFQYDPAIAKIIPEGSHAIAFKSGAKKFNTRKDRESNVVEGYLEPSKVNDSQMIKSNTEKIESAARQLGDGNRISIPLENIAIKQASREHTGNFSANTAVHFSEYGMVGANRWANSIQRMNTFEQRMQDVWLSPYSKTALMRRLAGYSQEIGDTYLINTGLDYILEREGILSSEYMLPIIEKQVVSAYLNGGSITTTPIYESSMDVMSPEGRNLSSPHRTDRQMDGIPIQRQFGGSRISEFNANKELKIYGVGNTNNQSTTDGHAIIVKLSDRGQGVMTGDGTLYVDGFMIRDGKIYDMNKSMSKEAKNLENPQALLDKYAKAQKLQKEFNESLVVDDKMSDAIIKAKEIGEEANQQVWVAALETRQPRNQAGDMIITKIEGITEGRGNVHETNMMDAYQVLDSDNDFDKVTTYTSSDANFWGEASRLAGHTVFSSEVDIRTFMDKTLAPFSRENGIFDATGQKGNVVTTSDVRSRMVKQHQVMTYLRNMFGNNTILEFSKPNSNDVLGVRLRNDMTSTLNTSNTLSKFVKHFIDVYKETPMEYNSMAFVKDAFRKIYFDNDVGMFELTVKKNNIHEKLNESIWDGNTDNLNTAYKDVVDVIEQRFFRPLGKYIGYNRGQEMTQETGYSRAAGIQEFSSAYENILFSFHPGNWKGIQSFEKTSKKKPPGTGLGMLNIESGLASARDYFSSRSMNPFDVAMRHMHNINQKKYKDIDFFQSDVGEFIRTVEEGMFDSKRIDSIKQQMINNAYKQYVENEFNMYSVITLIRKQKAIDYRLSELDRYGKNTWGDNDLETRNLEQKKIVMADAIEKLSQIMGAGRDFETAMENKMFNVIKHKGNDPNIYTNHQNTAVVVRDSKGNLKEIIPSGAKNKGYINKNDVMLQHGRRYEFTSEEKAGTYINADAFGGYPSIHNKGEFVDGMTKEQYAPYADWFSDLTTRLRQIRRQDVDKDGNVIQDKSGSLHANVSSSRKFELHEYLRNNPHVNINENSSLLQKWAFFNKMLSPSVDNATVLAFPLMVDGVKRMANQPKMKMHDFGRTEQLAMEYLNAVRMSETTGNYKDGILNSSEAKMILDYIIKRRKAATLKMERPMADYRLAMDGLSSSDIPVRESYLFSDAKINESIYDKVNESDKAIRDAAKVLVRYATGDGGMVDPATLYKASRRMIDAGIHPNQTFIEIAYDKPTRAFGDPIPRAFSMLNTERRRFGGIGVISESPTDFAKEITRCLKK